MRKNREVEEKPESPVLLVITIILAISTLFFPFLAIFIGQDILHFSNNRFLFQTPSAAYFIFAAGMLIIVAALVMHIIIRGKKEWKWLPIITFLLCLFSVPFFILGINSYIDINPEGIKVNGIANGVSWKEHRFSWDDVSEVHEVYIEDDVLKIEKRIFKFSDGTEIEVMNDADYNGNRTAIGQMIEQFNIPITDNREEE